MRESAEKKERAVGICILILVAAVQLCFIGQKEGYHMDELLSFELANARFNPWIVPTQPQGRLEKLYENEIEGENIWETLGNVWDLAVDVLQNRSSSLVANYKADVYEEPVWISGRQFLDYITVGDGDAFQYFSVYFNVKDDNHPPLHFMLLHTVSSLIRRKVLPLMGCIINLAAVLGCCILFLKLGKRLGSPALGWTAAVVYGLSGGAVATTLLIRMYGLMTFWCVASFYLHVKKWQEKDWSRRNKGLIAVTVLGFWTQYFFLFYCIGLALVMTAAFWRRKDWKSLLGYLRSMVCAALIGLAGFPFAVSDVFSSGRGVEALGNLAQGWKGYGARLLAFGEILWRSMAGNVCGLLLTLAVLGGLGAWLLWRAEKSRGCDPEKRLKRGFGKRSLCGFRKRLSKPAQEPFAAMLAVPPILYFLFASRMAPYLVDRYVMAVFPFIALGLACLADQLTALADKRLARGIVFAWAAVLGLLNIASYSGEYLYRGYQIQEEVSCEYQELPCICVYDGVGYYENLLEFTHYQKTLLLTVEELENRKDRQSILDQKQVVVLIKAMGTKPSEVLDLLEREYGLRQKEILLEEGSPYGDKIVLCEVS